MARDVRVAAIRVLLVPVLALLAACGGSTSNEPVAVAPATSARPEQASTTEQWAVLILRGQQGFDTAHLEYQANYDPTTIMGGGLEASEEGMRTAADSVELAATQLRDALVDGRTPGSPGYVGTPPNELVSLIDSTMRAANDASSVASDVASACSGNAVGFANLPEECTSTYLSAWLSADALAEELDLWAPYT